MKTHLRSWFVIFFTVFAIFASGCGGGGGEKNSDNQQDDSSGSPDISDLFPEVDIEALLKKEPDSVIKTSSDEVDIKTTPSDDSTKTSAQMVEKEASNGSSITLKTGVVIDDKAVGTPLFVDDEFKGMITSVTNTATNVEVGLKDADKISDVYKNFDLTFRNDYIVDSVNRALSGRNTVGKYDHLNKNPLQARALIKPVTNDQGITNDELVLRIDIPEGYQIPKNLNKVSCAYTDLSCNITIESSGSDKIDLEIEKEEGGVKFTTKGSFIEIGIGMDLRAHYDYNRSADDIFDFDYAQSAYFKADVTVEVSGTLSKEWSTKIDLLGTIGIEIGHPYSLVAKTSILINPIVIVGIKGETKGTITASSELKREGEVRFVYDSVKAIKDISHNIKYTPKGTTQEGVKASLEANVDAYIAPAIISLPSLTFLRVTSPITLVMLESQLLVNTNVNGKIETGFVVNTDLIADANGGTIDDLTYSEASITTTLQGVLLGKWYVRISPVDFYTSKESTEIFKTKQLSILEWKGILLKKPSIDIKTVATEFDTREISFDINIDDKIKPKMYYYYTLDGKNIPTENIAAHKPVWRSGDAPIKVNKVTKVKVRAVLNNKDVSKSLWAWGVSISQQADSLLKLIHEPFVSPDSRSFENALFVEMSQDQGYEIRYKKNGDNAVKYTQPVRITEDTTFVIFASNEIEGEKVFSNEVKRTYKKCAANESLDEGECVLDDITNSPPVAIGQTITVVYQKAKTIELTGTDDDDDSLTFTVVTQPQHGTLSGTAPNLIYTPDNGFSGEDLFTFNVNDGKVNSNTQSIYITVINLDMQRFDTAGCIFSKVGYTGLPTGEPIKSNVNTSGLFSDDATVTKEFDGDHFVFTRVVRQGTIFIETQKIEGDLTDLISTGVNEYSGNFSNVTCSSIKEKFAGDTVVSTTTFSFTVNQMSFNENINLATSNAITGSEVCGNNTSSFEYSRIGVNPEFSIGLNDLACSGDSSLLILLRK